MVENSTSTRIWIEKYSSQQIKINNSTNQYGVITKDNNNNYIGTPLQDNVYIDSCSSFTSTYTNPYLLIYDDSQWCLIKGTFDLSNDTQNIIGRYVFRQNTVPNYKIGAGIISSNFDGNSINIPSISSNIIFKIILNSEEVLNYSMNGDVITFSNYKLFGNTITIIYHSLTQTINPSDSIILTYLAPIKRQASLVEINGGISEVGTVSTSLGNIKVTGVGTSFTKFKKYSPIMLGNEIRYVDTVASDTELYVTKAFDLTYSAGTSYKSYPYINLITNEQDFNDNISRDFINQNKKYLRNGFNKINKETKNLTFSYFIDSDSSVCANYPIWTTNLIDLIGLNTKFRIITTNITSKEVVYYINMKNDEGTSLAMATDKNKINFNAKFQDKVIYKEDGSLGYGTLLVGTVPPNTTVGSYYGLGSYGGYRVSKE